MKKITLSLLALFFSINCFAQLPNCSWAFNIGGTLNADRANSVTTDPSGNVLATGWFQGTTDFDPGVGTQNLSSPSGSNIFVAKYTSGGQYIWAFAITASASRGRDIKTDVLGNVYVSGSFDGTADFDPGTGTTILSSSGSSDTDGFLAKYSSTGQLIWAFKIGSSASIDIGTCILIDQSSNVYLTGTFSGNVDFDPGVGVQNLSATILSAFVAKYNTSGQYLMAFGTQGGQTRAYGIKLDNVGNIFITGQYRFTVDFDPGTGVQNFTNTNIEDVFLAKYSSTGQYLWVITFGDVQSDIGWDLVVDGNNNVYLTGEYYGLVDIDPSTGTYNLTNTGTSDGFLVKYNSNGVFQWGFPFATTGSDFGLCVEIDAGSNIYVGGAFNGTIDFDPGVGIQNLTATPYNFFVGKYNSNGQYLFAFSVGGNSNLYSLALDVNSNLIGGGDLGGNADFDPTPATLTLSATNQPDFFIAKYTSTSTGLDKHENNFLFNVFPNPSSGKFTFEAKGDLEIYSTLGEKIFSQKLSADKTEIDLSGEAKGIYFVKIVGEDKTYSQKIIIQ